MRVRDLRLLLRMLDQQNVKDFVTSSKTKKIPEKEFKMSVLNGSISPSSPCGSLQRKRIKTLHSNPGFIPSKDSKNYNFVVRFVKRKTNGLTRRQLLIMVIFLLVQFFAGSVISIQAPFFPEVAERKGASATEYGMVFGIFEITVFIISPIFGSKMDAFGPKLLFNIGILITGASCVVFGLLNIIEDRFSFIGSCLLVRTVEAIGDAAFVTASFTIIPLEFPESIATTFGTMETFYGLGMIVGPTLGGALFEVGGFILPFAFMGSSLFALAAVTYFLLPEIGQRTVAEENGIMLDNSSIFEILKFLKIPVIAMIAYSIVATSIGVGFLSATFEPHLRQFGLSKFNVGAVVVINGGVYALSVPLWGWICDHTTQKKCVTLIGSVLTIVGFVLIGPLPFFPFDTILWVTCIGLVFFGLGFGAIYVSAFTQASEDAIAKGYPDNISTFGLVSGLVTSMTALGFFIGPTMGGVLIDTVGFRWGSLFVLAAHLILIGMLCIHFLTAKTELPSKNEVQVEQEAFLTNLTVLSTENESVQ